MEVRVKAKDLEERQLNLMKNELIKQLEDHKRYKLKQKLKGMEILALPAPEGWQQEESTKLIEPKVIKNVQSQVLNVKTMKNQSQKYTMYE